MATTPKRPHDLQPGDRFVVRGEEHVVVAQPFTVRRGTNVQVPYRATMGTAVVALPPDTLVPVEREAA